MKTKKIFMYVFLYISIFLFFKINIYAQNNKQFKLDVISVDTIKLDELTFYLQYYDWTLNTKNYNPWWLQFSIVKHFLTDIAGLTYITVFKDSLKNENVNLNEIAVSDSVFCNELIKREKNIENSRVYDDISKVKITEINRYGKKFYSLTFKTITLNRFPVEIGREIFYLYFPDDFKSRNVYYGFILNEYWDDRIIIKSDDSDCFEFLIETFKVFNN